MIFITVREDVNHLVNVKGYEGRKPRNAATPQSSLKCLLCASLNDQIQTLKLNRLPSALKKNHKP
jgi:hypothetical protein